jgi:perosamine synthetase
MECGLLQFLIDIRKSVFCPMNQQPVLHNLKLFVGESYPVAEKLYKKGFYIPSGVAITEAQIEHVIKAVIEVLG